MDEKFFISALTSFIWLVVIHFVDFWMSSALLGVPLTVSIRCNELSFSLVKGNKFLCETNRKYICITITMSTEHLHYWTHCDTSLLFVADPSSSLIHRKDFHSLLIVTQTSDDSEILFFYFYVSLFALDIFSQTETFRLFRVIFCRFVKL